MRLAFVKEGEREHERFECDLMREDLNKYTPNRKRFFRDKHNEIMWRHATKSIFQDDDSSQAYIPSPPPSQGGGYHY